MVLVWESLRHLVHNFSVKEDNVLPEVRKKLIAEQFGMFRDRTRELFV